MSHEWEWKLDPYRGKEFKGQWPTIPEMMMLAVHKYPHRPCFTAFDPEKRTKDYTEVFHDVERTASWLIEHGFKPGDRVALKGKNSPEWGTVYIAAQYAGGIIVPIDNQMKIDHLQDLASFVGASFFFADGDTLSKLDPNNAWVQSIKGKMVKLLGKEDIEGVPQIWELKPEKTYGMVPRTEDDIAALLFTSGTTGKEKVVQLSHKNLVSDTYMCADVMPFVTEKDVLYCLLPLHHTYCCTADFLEVFEHGAEGVFGESMAISRIVNDLKQGQVTIFMGIPLIFNKVLAAVMKEMKKKGPFVYAFMRLCMWWGGFCKVHFGKNPMRPFFNKTVLSKIGFDKFVLCISGAGPLAPVVFKRWQQFGLNFVQGYGLTETSPVLTLNPSEHFKIDSIGPALPLVDLIIADKNEHGVGEIRVKGPCVTRGYYHDEANTKALFDENGYLKTGDLATMDSEGYVHLKGRAKNMIVTEGGKNVYPEEIEDLFQTYDVIQQIMIRGYQAKKDVPSESIEAVIYSDPKNADRKAQIQAAVDAVNADLPGYKKITKITIVDEPMAMTSTLKIKRNLVK